MIDREFLKVCKKRGNKIAVINGLGDRKLLFLRSMERFFLLQNFIEKENLDNILFLELDNLIYDNPNNWEEELKKQKFTLMYDNKNTVSTGLIYIMIIYISIKLNKN